MWLVKGGDKVVPGYLCVKCGRAAFFLKKVPLSGDKVSAMYAYNRADKGQPETNAPIVCQFCGLSLGYGMKVPTQNLGFFDGETGEFKRFYRRDKSEED